MELSKAKFVFIIWIFHVVSAGLLDDDNNNGFDDSDNNDNGFDDDFGEDNGTDVCVDESEDKCRPKKETETRTGSGCNVCGVSQADNLEKGRVIKGKPVVPLHKYPWIVSLKLGGTINCGGALISATAVLTAAHCVFNHGKLLFPACNGRRVHKRCYWPPRMFKVELLAEDSRTPSESLAVKRIITHPMNSFTLQLNDVAILLLEKPVRCSEFTSPICLPTKDSLKLGTQLIIAGYGYNTPEGIDGPQVLREGTIRAINPRRCAKQQQPRNVVKKIVCAAGLDSGQSSCFGDSGSALFGRFGGKFRAVGVVAFGMSMRCSGQNPVAFMKTHAYLSFIKRNVKDLPRS